MATRRRVSRKNIVNTISDTERRLAYVEKLPTKTTLADGSVTTAKIANSSITKQKVVFGTVNPIADIPGAGSVTEQAGNSLYFDSGTGSLVGVDDNGDQIPVVDLIAQEDATTAINNASTALTSASGKNKVFHQGTAPTNGDASPNTLQAGDLWFDSSAGYRMSKYSGSDWGPFQLNSLALSNLDAGVITTGELTGRKVNLNGGGSTTVIESIKTKQMQNDVATIKVTVADSALAAGDSVVVAGVGDGFNGYVKIITSVLDVITYSAVISGQANIAEVNSYVEIIQKQIVSKKATLTTYTAHSFHANSIGVYPTVTVSGLGAPFDGTHQITETTSGSGNNTFSFKINSANQSSSPVSPFGKAYPTITKTTYPSEYKMTLSPSLDVSMFPTYDGNTADQIYSPGLSISSGTNFSTGFAGLDGVTEVHSIYGAYQSNSSEAGYTSANAVFGTVFGISTTAFNYTDAGALGAGMNVSINGASTGSFGASPARAPAVVELYGDIVKLKHIGDYLVDGGPNIAHNGTDLTDFRTVLRYKTGLVQGDGGIQPGTIAWTTSAVTGVTLTGGVAGDLVFKYTV